MPSQPSTSALLRFLLLLLVAGAPGLEACRQTAPPAAAGDSSLPEVLRQWEVRLEGRKVMTVGNWPGFLVLDRPQGFNPSSPHHPALNVTFYNPSVQQSALALVQACATAEELIDKLRRTGYEVIEAALPSPVRRTRP